MIKLSKRKNIEFSKIIMVVAMLMALCVSVFTCAVIWRTGDTSPLEWLIPAVFAVLTAATGFYYSKAKAENQIKLRKKYGAEIYNDIKEDNTDGKY